MAGALGLGQVMEELVHSVFGKPEFPLSSGGKAGVQAAPPACVPDLSTRSGERRLRGEGCCLPASGGGCTLGGRWHPWGKLLCPPPAFGKSGLQSSGHDCQSPAPQSKECSEKRPPLKDFRPVTVSFCPCCANIYSEGDDNIQTSH